MVAIADYDGSAHGGVLSFHKGDPVRVFKKKSDDWLEGEIGGTTGLVPASYVRPVTAQRQQKSTAAGAKNGGARTTQPVSNPIGAPPRQQTLATRGAAQAEV